MYFKYQCIRQGSPAAKPIRLEVKDYLKDMLSSAHKRIVIGVGCLIEVGVL